MDLQPSAASWRAIAKPMPCAPPVMMALVSLLRVFGSSMMFLHKIA